MAELLRQVGELLPFVAVGVSVVGGLIGLALANRGAMRSRSDRKAAASVAVGLAAVAGGIAGLLVAMFAAGFGGGSFVPILPAMVAAVGIPVGLVVIGASTTGYVTLARLRPGGQAVAGAVVGPALLGAALLTAAWMVQTSQSMLADVVVLDAADQMAARSTGLHLTVDKVTTTLDAKGLVSSVQMRLTIRSEADLPLELLPGKLVYPLFFLSPSSMRNRDPSREIQTEAPAGSPGVLGAGTATSYDLLFDPAHAGTPSLSLPGGWFLAIRMTGADGQEYGLDTAIVLAAG